MNQVLSIKPPISGTLEARLAEAPLIYQAIPRVMAAVGAIEKTRKNQSQGYQFRGIDDILSAFQRPLADNGLFFVPDVISEEREQVASQAGKVLFYTRLRVAYTFFALDGSSVRAVVQGEAMDSGDKSSNKAMSAALKYALLQVFCVPTEADDPDEDAHEVSRDKPKPATAAQFKPQAKSVTPKPAPVAQPVNDEQAELVAQTKALIKEAGFTKISDIVPALAKAMDVAECQPSRFTEWLQQRTAIELQEAVAWLEEKIHESEVQDGLVPRDDEAPAVSPRKAFDEALALFKKAFNGDSLVLRWCVKTFGDFSTYHGMNDAQVLQATEFMQNELNQLVVS